MYITQVMVGVRMCTPFRISETAGRIALKSGLWLETHKLGAFQKLMVGCRCMCAPLFPYLGNGWTDCAKTWCVVRGPLAMRFTQNGGYAHSARLTYTHLSTSVTRSRSFIAQKACYWFYDIPAID